MLGQDRKLGQIFLQIISLTINSISIQNNLVADFLFLLVISKHNTLFLGIYNLLKILLQTWGMLKKLQMLIFFFGWTG